jgi:hypothetical protein
LITPSVPSAKLFGIDIDSSVLKIAKKELLSSITGSPYDIELKIGDFFLDYPSNIPTKEFDIIIGNPPHNARYSQLEWQTIRKNCGISPQTPIRSESSVFFTIKSLNLLKAGGILCYLLPKPITYSKRWTEFRKIILTNYKLVEVVDLGNQFSGQLQEQCALIIKKQIPDIKHQKYKTAIWNPDENRLEQISIISNSDAILVDNLLVGVIDPELEIIHRIYSEEYEFLNVTAFRGLSSRYRVEKGTIPLVEKVSFEYGFLLPPRSFLKGNTPKQRLIKQKIPKIIAQRIISYRSKPKFLLNVKTWVDQKGAVLTHETVINIIPNYSQEILSLSAIAGLLKSSLIEWWLRHAVYTKRFVTSKDFDRAYINLIRIPHISDSKSTAYREKLSELLNFNQFERIMIEIRSQTVIDKFFTLGEIFCKYQSAGEILGTKICHLIQDKRIQNSNQRRTEFKKLRWIYRQLEEGLNTADMFQGSLLADSEALKYITSIKTKFKELQTLQTYMDEVVFSLYKITPIEQKLIKGEIT